MKIYGYSKDKENQLLDLSEATISAPPNVLREMAGFLIRCAEEIENIGDSWEHEHFDGCAKGDPDLIVHNPKVG